MALKDTWVDKTRDDYNNEQIPNELAAAIIELERRGGGEAQGLPLKKEISSSQFVDTLENNTITYVSVGENILNQLWLTINVDDSSEYVQRWGLVFTVGTSDFAFYAPENLKWAAADPVFTQGSTFRMSFEKVGDYIIGAWDEVTI